MFTCTLCRFEFPLDDTIVTTTRGGCICLRCYLRNVEDQKTLPRDLFQAVARAAAAA